MAVTHLGRALPTRLRDRAATDSLALTHRSHFSLAVELLSSGSSGYTGAKGAVRTDEAWKEISVYDTAKVHRHGKMNFPTCPGLEPGVWKEVLGIMVRRLLTQWRVSCG